MVHLCPVLCLRHFLIPKASEKGGLEICIIMGNFCLLCIRKSLLSNSMLVVVKHRNYFIFSPNPVKWSKCFHYLYKCSPFCVYIVELFK